MDSTLLIWLLMLLRRPKERPKATETSKNGASPSIFVTNKKVTFQDEMDAQFGRGKFVGKTGNPFVDDPFFNPWAPGGSFNK